MKKIHLHIQSLPVYTPAGHPLYAAGNFNQWKTGDQAYMFTKNGDGTFSLCFETELDRLDFSINRGGWHLAEGDDNGEPGPVHQALLTQPATVIPVRIASWIDFKNEITSHTATRQVHIIDHQFYIPQLNRHRRILAWLPAGYWTGNQRYPVLYMQDGQNLFDSNRTLGGEWKIDESLESHHSAEGREFIVIGIDHGAEKRLDEYAPWRNPREGGGEGKKYADFLVQTLKPYIDRHFRTLPDHNNTGIMGSSMGGLISLYTAMQNQDVFGMAGIFSPSLWFTNDIFEFIKTKGKEFPVKWMLLAGKKESDRMAADMLKLYFALSEAGFRKNEIHLDLHAEGTHSEWFWNREFLHAVNWMFDTETVHLDPHCTASPIDICFNDAQQHLEISVDPRVTAPYAEIFRPDGTRISQRRLFYCNNVLQAPEISPGVVLRFLSAGREIYTKQIPVSQRIKMIA